eukprot:7140085-Prymnesium_polylepis.1
MVGVTLQANTRGAALTAATVCRMEADRIGPKGVCEWNVDEALVCAVESCSLDCGRADDLDVVDVIPVGDPGLLTGVQLDADGLGLVVMSTERRRPRPVGSGSHCIVSSCT